MFVDVQLILLYFCSVHRGLKSWRLRAVSLMLMTSVTHWPEQWVLHQNPFPLTSNLIYWTLPEIRGNHSPIRPLSQSQVSHWVESGQKCLVFYLVLDSKLFHNILNLVILACIGWFHRCRVTKTYWKGAVYIHSGLTVIPTGRGDSAESEIADPAKKIERTEGNKRWGTFIPVRLSVNRLLLIMTMYTAQPKKK